jgi:drug/metabolite transporter (DMT)-like permease
VRLPAVATPGAAVAALACAVLIYGGNFTANRSAIQAGLTPDDMVALRFLVAGPLLLPVFIALGWRTCAGIGWGRGIVLALTSGIPMVFLMNIGLSMAPAAFGAAVQPGMVTVVATLGGFLLFGVRPTLPAVGGISTAILGLALIGAAGAASAGPQALTGVVLFAIAGAIWGGYVVLARKFGVDPLAATVAAAVISGFLWAPWYFTFGTIRITEAPLGLVAFHAFNQGIMNTIVALWLFTSGAARLGPAVAGRFPPMIPVMGLLFAVGVLGEIPTPLQIFGMALIVLGLLATTLPAKSA